MGMSADMTPEDMAMPVDMMTDMPADMPTPGDMPADMMLVDMPPDMVVDDMGTDMGAEMGEDMPADMPPDMQESPFIPCDEEGATEPEVAVLPRHRISVGRYFDDSMNEQRILAISNRGQDANDQQNQTVVSIVDTGAGSGFNGGVGMVTTQIARSSLPGPDGSNSRSFGFATALSPDARTLAIGAPTDGVEGNPGAGRVYIFERAEGQSDWVYSETVQAPAGIIGDNFGFDVVLTSDPEGRHTLVVGAPTANITIDPNSGVEYSNAGAVYVFTRDITMGSTFTFADREHLIEVDEAQADQMNDLAPFRISALGRFGFSVDATGTWQGRDLTVIVGAPTQDLNFANECTYPNAGAAYLLYFVQQGPVSIPEEDFTLATYILPDTGDNKRLETELGATPAFGADVALTGTIQVVQGVFSGSIAYVIAAPQARSGAGEVFFGLDGISEPNAESTRPYLAYLTRSVNGFSGPELEANDYFGAGVDIVGAFECIPSCNHPNRAALVAVVGAKSRQVPNAMGEGAVHAFGMFLTTPSQGMNQATWDYLSMDGSVRGDRGYYKNGEPGGGFGQDVHLLESMTTDIPSFYVTSGGTSAVPVEVVLEREP